MPGLKVTNATRVSSTENYSCPTLVSICRAFFSLLACTFIDQQDRSLEDYIETSLMLQFIESHIVLYKNIFEHNCCLQ